MRLVCAIEKHFTFESKQNNCYCRIPFLKSASDKITDMFATNIKLSYLVCENYDSKMS